MVTETYLKKALRAAEGQTTKALRGYLDQASKRIICDRQVLARIVKECVKEAARFSISELEKLIPGEIQVSDAFVDRFETEVRKQDPGPVRQENTEDGTVDEGTVRFDILFTLELPGEKDPVLLVINVEIQNRADLPYPLSARSADYSCRLVSRQGTDYKNLKKVYSVWIVTDPQGKAPKNTSSQLVIAERDPVSGALREAPAAAQVFEVWMLYLGDPKDVEPSLLRMLDVIFTQKMNIEEKTSILHDEFDMQMTTRTTEDLERILDMELAIEARGRAEGREEGIARGLLQMGLMGHMGADVIMAALMQHFGGDQEKAQDAFRAYLEEHPAEGLYLAGSLPWLQN